jgi:tetratricopeptide (TPR) repeat protein/tRNA A-37 threonylcarbamoyl transferase component Bud32
MDLRDQLQETLGATYALERELGGGGMSRVFVAQERRLNRKVVIKVLSTELTAGVSADRFEREIQLAASLQQANIVPILAAGETDGMPFYTMPFVEGESLRVLLGKSGGGLLSISMVQGVLRDVAKALSYAHERGVVHRDIKPDNVLLSGGTAVVTDFGIAKAISAARASQEGSTLTQLGTSIGTPAYMSPEQAAGDPSVDHRADIYSLGCMAYELLTGQPPFHGKSPARTLAAHMTETPRSVGDARADTPPALAQLVMRCLEKEPAQRPQSGAEIVRAIDTMTSTGTATVPEILSVGRMGKRGVAVYAAAVVVIAILARASVIALGLPDWVFPGALGVMLLGLPVILFTWYVNRTMRKLATSTAPLTPGGSPVAHSTMTALAVKASPHVSWRRAWLGGAIALGAFVLIVAVFMALRALGIGPAGTLLAAGKLSDRERLIVTEFQSPDTSLSTLVTEAVRTNLGQSRVVSIMPPVAIAAALRRMERPPTSRLDLRLAREIAAREGVKAIVDGAVRPLGGGYVVSVRLVSADSANELAAFQESANGPRELLETIDEVSRKLRGKMGESLRDIRGSPPLEQVTTPSLEALRIYAEASRAVDMGGSPIEAAERLREAVRIDTAFAMAWRKLGVAVSNSGLPRVRVDSALERAYRFRDRLTERERLLTEGTYYHLGPGRDRRRAIQAYERLLAIDPTESGAANNLGSILSGRRDFARAESVFKRQIADGRASSQQYTNLMAVLFNSAKVDEAEGTLNEYRQRFPQATAGVTAELNFLYQRGQLDSLEKLARNLATNSNPVVKINGVGALASLSFLRGRLTEGFSHGQEARRIQASLGGPATPAVYDTLNMAWIDMMYYDDTIAAVGRLDRALAKTDLRRIEFGRRPDLALAAFYASAGQPQRARALVAQWERDIPDSTARRLAIPDLNEMAAVIASAEGRHEEAVRLLWKADTTYDGPDGNCAMCSYDDLGWIWNRAGVADSAIVWFERFLQTPYYGRFGMDATQRALIVKRLGELHESKGDATKAARRYREFIELWERAEPRLQPKVAEVRRKLSRLADTEHR